MSVLIRVLQNEKTIATCDETCYDSPQSYCACLCGGRCHGLGRDAAQARIKGDSRRLLENIRHLYPHTTDVRVTFLRTVELTARYRRNHNGHLH